jgi:hypothetical protein
MDFADDIRNCIDTLSAAGLIAEISTQGSLLLIVEKLPYHLQLRWRREACELQSRSSRLPTIDDIYFISRASQEANDPIYGRLGIPSSKTTNTNFKSKSAKHRHQRGQLLDTGNNKFKHSSTRAKTVF